MSLRDKLRRLERLQGELHDAAVWEPPEKTPEEHLMDLFRANVLRFTGPGRVERIGWVEDPGWYAELLGILNEDLSPDAAIILLTDDEIDRLYGFFQRGTVHVYPAWGRQADWSRWSFTIHEPGLPYEGELERALRCAFVNWWPQVQQMPPPKMSFEYAEHIFHIWHARALAAFDC